VQTKQFQQQLTIPTTTATPRIAHLFVCVLAADNLSIAHFLNTGYPFTFQHHWRNFQFTTPHLLQRCVCLFGNRQKSVNEFMMFC
jgi:hypothetical protein